MCDKAVSNDLLMLKYCLDRYKTQGMCDKAVDKFLLALKFVPDRFVTSKMIKKLDDAWFANYNILFFDEDPGSFTFSSDEMGILSVHHDKINLDDVNFDEDDPETIIHVRLMSWHNRYKQCKSCKKDISKGLMPWHPKRWYNWCMPHDGKKEIESICTDKN